MVGALSLRPGVDLASWMLNGGQECLNPAGSASGQDRYPGAASIATSGQQPSLQNPCLHRVRQYRTSQQALWGSPHVKGVAGSCPG